MQADERTQLLHVFSHVAAWLGGDGQHRHLVPSQRLTQVLVAEEHLALVYLSLPLEEVSLNTNSTGHKLVIFPCFCEFSMISQLKKTTMRLSKCLLFQFVFSFTL